MTAVNPRGSTAEDYEPVAFITSRADEAKAILRNAGACEAGADLQRLLPIINFLAGAGCGFVDRALRAERHRDRYKAALEKIAHGPNSAPTVVEPWSRAEALIALEGTTDA